MKVPRIYQELNVSVKARIGRYMRVIGWLCSCKSAPPGLARARPILSDIGPNTAAGHLYLQLILSFFLSFFLQKIRIARGNATRRWPF